MEFEDVSRDDFKAANKVHPQSYTEEQGAEDHQDAVAGHFAFECMEHG
jgi:hypothetical protein